MPPRRGKMFITTTTCKTQVNQIGSIKALLAPFLPRGKELLGVVAVYNYLRPEQKDDVTIIIWED
jgi:hypothetical protein